MLSQQSYILFAFLASLLKPSGMIENYIATEIRRKNIFGEPILLQTFLYLLHRS